MQTSYTKVCLIKGQILQINMMSTIYTSIIYVLKIQNILKVIIKTMETGYNKIHNDFIKSVKKLVDILGIHTMFLAMEVVLIKINAQVFFEIM